MPTSKSKNKIKQHPLAKIDKLSPAIRDALEAKILSGGTSESIATWLRTEHSVIIHVETVRRYVQNYRKQHEDEGIRLYRRFLKDQDVCVDGLKTLCEAIVIQKSRIGRALRKEQSDGKNTTATDKTVQVLKELSQALLAGEMDLGIKKRVSTDTGTAAASSEELAKVIIQATDLAKKMEAKAKETEKTEEIQTKSDVSTTNEQPAAANPS